MSYTQGQLDGLRAAFASGTTRVSYEGKTVEYRSLAELQQAIGVVEQALGLRPARSRLVYPETTRDGR